jgi:type IV secretory pathway VirB2 component (pilin)
MKVNLWFQKLILIVVINTPYIAYADVDPFTSAGNGMTKILFGTLGTSLCSIIIAATFLMAKIGKVTWDKFISVAICTAGFLGAPSIVTLIKGWT